MRILRRNESGCLINSDMVQTQKHYTYHVWTHTHSHTYKERAKKRSKCGKMLTIGDPT